MNCAEDPSLLSSNRVRRHTENGKADGVVEPLVEVSNISFRVMMPTDFHTIKSFKQAAMHSKGEIALFITIASVSLLIVVVLIIIKKRVHRQTSIWDKS